MGLSYYSKDYFERLKNNKDVFVYGALTGALILYIIMKKRK